MQTKLFITWLLAALSTLAGEISLSFDVRSDGKRVENAEVLFLEDGNVWGSFRPVTSGSIKFQPNSSTSTLEYLIRARGYAITSGILPKDLRDPIQVNLERGIGVELKIVGPNVLPKDLLPVVFPEKVFQDVAFSMDARVSHGLLNVIDVQRDDSNPGTFRFHSAPDVPFRVLIHHPGYLKGFISDALTPAPNLEVKLPKPAGLQVSFRPATLRDTEKALVVAFKTFKEANASVRMVYEQNTEAVSGFWNDLAPGDYRIEGAEINPTNLTKRTEQIRQVLLSAGSKETLTLVPAADQPRLRGDSTIRIRVRNFEGRPLGHALYEFTFFDTNTMATLSVACGKTTESGDIALKNVKSGKDAPHLHAKINGVSQLVQFTKEGREQDIELTVPPTAGDFAPHFEVKDLLSGASLAYPNGRYTIVDFWAVSCGACQTPMAEINDLWRRKAGAWSNLVEIIAINLDDTKEEALKRIAEKHWESISHAWEPNAFDSMTAKKYHVPWLPTSVLISPNGQILWYGDPRAINFEQTIDALLSGKLKPEALISSHRNWLDSN
jgi:thiol-disulfide isomerase/thioredoxin